jgi:hypothetical protein
MAERLLFGRGVFNKITTLFAWFNVGGNLYFCHTSHSIEKALS